MKIKLQPGRYIVAVSGGVDSVVLLNILRQQAGMDLVVAHFDHGIRPDSADDAAFVSQLAVQYDLPFVTKRVELGAQASEATARQARYSFLREAMEQANAQAVVTAHHQDDVLETAILNILRGTGRRGLASLQSTELIKRPLLSLPKSELQTYAIQHHLSWREDTTNRDERYARNYIRHRLLVKFDARTRQQLLAAIERITQVNAELDALLASILAERVVKQGIDRQWFISLPHTAAREVMATWLRQNGIADFDRRTIERLTVGAKTKPANKRLDVLRGRYVAIAKQYLVLSK
jgi:tRNA(Ile)-lysidine synthase